MGNEQQALISRRPESLVVEGGNPGLAGAGGSDNQVPKVATLALGAERFEDLDLEGLRLDVDAAGAVRAAGRDRRLFCASSAPEAVHRQRRGS